MPSSEKPRGAESSQPVGEDRREPIRWDAGDLPEPRAWKLAGVGMYGSDVDVISLDTYRELDQKYGYAISSCDRWAKAAKEAQARADSLEAALGELVRLRDMKEREPWRYEHREQAEKDAAWDAARSLLSSHPKATEGEP